MADRSSSSGEEATLVLIYGEKYDPSNDVNLGGLGMKGGDSMPT